VDIKVAVITGCTRGIGKAVFKRLAAQGVSVAGVYHRDEEAADLFRSEAEEVGIPWMLEKFDVCEFDRIPDFIQKVDGRLGRIDYLLNNVGVDNAAGVLEVTPEQWKRSQDTILNVPLFFMKAVIPRMRSRHFGRIVNIGASSKDYLKGAAGLGPYGVHKAALEVLTKTAALEEISNGITVNMVAPGSTAGAGTLMEEERIPVDKIPLGRRVDVEEVAEAVMYFFSEKSGAVTGQFLGVNGGLST
jgi:acetoacetyl-CoA reductase